jgi:hypothetical protein
VSFTISQFAELRTYLYHVTARENLVRLRRTMRLEPTALLLQAAGRSDLLRVRRERTTAVRINGDEVVLKDQRPLIAANAALPPNWEFGDLVQYLNEHVFFWPGDALAAVAAGRRLLAHYADAGVVVLRVRLNAVLELNPDAVPLFCPYNSGAPRQHRGNPVPRGPDLFRPAGEARRRRHEIIEIGFRSAVSLPLETQVAGEPEKWYRLAAI